MNAFPVTFVVATYNRSRLIEAKLGYLEALSKVAQVIVIDDGSDDDTISVLRAAFAGNRGVQLLRNHPNGGSAYCWNLGSREARGRIVVYLADDALDLVLSPERFINGLLRSAEHAQLVGIHVDEEQLVAPPLLRFASRLVAAALYVLAAQVIPVNSGKERYVDFVPGIMGVRRDVACGVLFDEDCFVGSGYREESDFQLRARRRGFRIIYSPSLSVRHRPIRRGGQSQKVSKKGYAYWAIRNHVIFAAGNRLRLWPLRLAFFIPYQIVLHGARPESISSGVRDGFSRLHRCATFDRGRV